VRSSHASSICFLVSGGKRIGLALAFRCHPRGRCLSV
jgi:hypothetical protein